MNEILLSFSPNRALSKTSTSIIIALQVFAILVIACSHFFVFVPTPNETLHAFSQLWVDDSLLFELITSFKLNLEAIAMASAISLLLAYSTVLPFCRPIVTFISKLRFLSMVGLSFFFMLAAKNGHELKLYLLVFSITVFFVTSMADVLNAIPKTQYDLARTLRMGEWRVVWEVIILGQIDKVFDVVRQNAAIGWMMLTMVEGMSREEGGIGALLLNQNKHFHLSAVLAIQATILIVGLGQDYALGVAKGIFCPYAEITVERK